CRASTHRLDSLGDLLGCECLFGRASSDLSGYGGGALGGLYEFPGGATLFGHRLGHFLGDSSHLGSGLNDCLCGLCLLGGGCCGLLCLGRGGVDRLNNSLSRTELLFAGPGNLGYQLCGFPGSRKNLFECVDAVLDLATAVISDTQAVVRS